MPLLEKKVKRIYEVGARTVVMPACHLDGTDDYYPNPKDFKKEIIRLKKKYPNTITTPKGFLDNIEKVHGCSTSSIIIDSEALLPRRPEAFLSSGAWCRMTSVFRSRSSNLGLPVILLAEASFFSEVKAVVSFFSSGLFPADNVERVS
jgi:hypothetical protein